MTFVRQKWTGLHTILAMSGIVLLWIIIPIGFKSCARDILIEAQAPIWTALRDVSSFQDTAALQLQSKDALIKIIQELAQTQAGLELKLKSADAMEAEKNRLEQLLKMDPAINNNSGYETKAARIINRDLNGWWQELWIDAGRAQGMRPGMGVVASFGIVGRVREVYDQTSVVELATSPRFRMAVQMKGDDRPFVYQGMGLRFGMSPAGSVMALQPEMRLKGDQSALITTTGLSGSFPAGLPVGELTDTNGLSDGGLLEGKVKLPAELQNIREVAVLVPYR